jgi:hypothetical protein
MVRFGKMSESCSVLLFKNKYRNIMNLKNYIRKKNLQRLTFRIQMHIKSLQRMCNGMLFRCII